MVHELRRQPLRALYLTFEILKTLTVRLPIWLLASLTKYTRPRPSWSPLKSCLVGCLRVWSEFSFVAEKVGFIRSWPDHRAIPNIPGVKSVWLDPALHVIVGEVKQWADEAGVQAVSIPGYWMDREGQDTVIGAQAESGENVVLYLHGGGFMSDSAHPTGLMGTIPRQVLKHCCDAKRAFSVEYRLCELSPECTNPFPTALIDALAGYHYLTQVVGFPPSSIVVLGDSAGASLALALTRYLVENASALPYKSDTPPFHSMILLSPWADFGTSHSTPTSSAITSTSDFLPDLHSGIFAATLRAYTGPLGLTAINTNRYLSPASLNIDVSFVGFPRAFIAVGGAERFLDMSRTLKDRMARDIGGDDVLYWESPDAIHDHMLFPFEEPQNTATLKAIEDWLEGL